MVEAGCVEGLDLESQPQVALGIHDRIGQPRNKLAGLEGQLLGSQSLECRLDGSQSVFACPGPVQETRLNGSLPWNQGISSAVVAGVAARDTAARRVTLVRWVIFIV